MISPLATPAEVAEALHTTTASLAQMRYRGAGPTFVRAGKKRVLYRWMDVEQWITDSLHNRTDD
ncbi:helix-turn-helix transcriptional regulator [Mycobacterium sp.]|uniref:helix-turn-helix transcriptional regulator n=1 Tax=Mycobacterium sp. TaxID=1785 RepID=UPI003C741593